MKNRFLSQIIFSMLLSMPEAWARTPVPPMKFFHDPALTPADQILGWVFIGIILAGGVLLIIASFMDVIFSAPGYRTFLGMYLACWVGYAIWYLDVRFGLPAGVNRFQILPILLGGVAGLLLLREAVDFLRDYFRPLEQGMVKCPRCREIYSKLMFECPACRKKNKYA